VVVTNLVHVICYLISSQTTDTS